ncbi:hypothetical protein LX36DRAFT_197873 [Colletotrichum falcatum]|nr:hypothetical protein LX36DRAFT_197873 [Colletotrichum falcatum]
MASRLGGPIGTSPAQIRSTNRRLTRGGDINRQLVANHMLDPHYHRCLCRCQRRSGAGTLRHLAVLFGHLRVADLRVPDVKRLLWLATQNLPVDDTRDEVDFGVPPVAPKRRLVSRRLQSSPPLTLRHERSAADALVHLTTSAREVALATTCPPLSSAVAPSRGRSPARLPFGGGSRAPSRIAG